MAKKSIIFIILLLLAMGVLLYGVGRTTVAPWSYEVMRGWADSPPSYKRYILLGYEGGLKLTLVQRRNPSPRELQTLEGKKNITLVSGYKTYYAYPGGDTFVRVFPEKSSPETFAHDKQVVLDQLDWISEVDNIGLQEREYGGRSVTLFNKARDDPQVRSIAQLFIQEEHMIVTLYFMNGNAFENEEEFLKLQDRFLEALVDSINSRRKYTRI